MEDAAKLTPMMQQYRAAKAEIPADAILLFRLGDFYEMFFEDAELVSQATDLNLTRRQGYPMCGFPYFALDVQLPRLLGAGLKVAIAEQMEDPKFAKGIVKRAITRIITPGTAVDASVLDPSRNNFLVALTVHKERFGIASLDISTGEFRVTELDSIGRVETELNRLGARECVIPKALQRAWDANPELPRPRGSMMFTPLDDWIFTRDYAHEFLTRHFKVATLDGFGCRELTVGLGAAGAVMHYAAENLRQDAAHVNRLVVYRNAGYMELDAITQRNLELVEPLFGTDRSNTLLAILDRTKTPMGGRLLRDWVLRPLYELEGIRARQDAIEALRDDALTLTEMRETLSAVRDLERIVGRLNIGNANARDVAALAHSLAILPGMKLLLSNFSTPLLDTLATQIQEFPELVDEIEKALNDELPLTLNDGGLIRTGYHDGLDELRRAATEGKQWLGDIQKREQERTGIKSLKVRYNQVFGYYIEISKSNLELAPDDYIRKQTLTNAERFITPELKELESKILGAEEKSKALEFQLFQKLRDRALGFTVPVQETALALAQLDALMALADCARERRYVRPHMTDDRVLSITGGRHPVLDARMTGERFVPNDVLLDGDLNRMMLITGPNMAGKSTYIRQTALLVLMAQLGSFIPADDASIGMADRIFTRVGAADDLSRGQSTFMVEMIETANILNNASPDSLVILDEIGRGTSTFDGLSIAWAVAEFLHDEARCGCRTQFATHYHELTELASRKKGIKNYNVAVKEYNEQIIFLRQIVPGATDRSYGIHVAQLAGLPVPVIDRAKVILETLENGDAERDRKLADKSAGYSQSRRRKQAMAIEDSVTAYQPGLF